MIGSEAMWTQFYKVHRLVVLIRPSSRQAALLHCTWPKLDLEEQIRYCQLPPYQTRDYIEKHHTQQGVKSILILLAKHPLTPTVLPELRERYENSTSMADTIVKPDPDTKSLEGGSPMAVDDDPYEDLDLEFYETTDANGLPTPQDRLLMARVPTYVWAAWDKIEDDTPIEIGRLRMWSEPDKKHPQNKKQQMRLLLKSNVSAHQGLPREYDLFDTNQDVKNTFIFNESDLEAFKSKNKMRREAADQNIPAYLLRPKSEKPAHQQHNSRGRRNRKDTFRQVIPKKTAVYGRVRQEFNMNPIDNPETAYLMAIRAQEQIQPKNTTQIIDRFIVTNNVVQAGTTQATQAFGTFIVSYCCAPCEMRQPC